MQTDKFPITPLPDLSQYTAPRTPGPRLRVCIATEEIVGPVRNGGIASTYFHLARLLVAQGHDVTVCYLKGRRVENKDVDHWIKWYGDMGVTFVPLPHIACETPSMWQHRQYSFYQWMKDAAQPFDVVHVSEWRGGAYYALQARRLGLAFPETLFLVKASSPHIWNRHYQMSFVNSAEVLAVMYAEQQSIELADMVIGGSAHLLRFMEHTGYTLPPDDTYVQPNVLLFDDVAVQDQRGPLEIGDRMDTKELTFFGRLEARKGLEIFCTALDYLVDRGITPERVSFVGKQGANMPTTPNRRNLDVIMDRARNWPFPIDIHTGFDQPDVLSFLTAAPRIAVMPSLIENSTMAAYEALLYKVPFIATRTGGTPELIAPEDHDDMLVEANPKSLADGLERVLRKGGKIGRCSFDNADNIATWNAFHDHLAGRKGDGTLTQITHRPAPLKPQTLSLCIFAEGDANTLQKMLKKALTAGEEGLSEIIVATTKPGAAITALANADGPVPVHIVDAPEMTLGEAWNSAAARATGDVLHFLRADIHLPLKGFATALTTAFATPGLAAAGSVWQRRTVDDTGAEKLTRVVPMGDDLASTALDYTHLSGRGVSIRAAHFRALDGFDPIFAMDGIAQDLLMRARALGRIVVIPDMLYREDPAAETLLLNQANAQYMAMNALMNALDYPQKRLVHALNLRAAEAAAEATEWPGRAPMPPVEVLTPATGDAALTLTMVDGLRGVLIQPTTPLDALTLAFDGADPEPLNWDSDDAGSVAYIHLPELIGGLATWPRQIDITAQTAGQTLRRQLRIAMQANGVLALSADAPGLCVAADHDQAPARLLTMVPEATVASDPDKTMRLSYDAQGQLLHIFSPMPRKVALQVADDDPKALSFAPEPTGGYATLYDLAPLLTDRSAPVTLSFHDGVDVFRRLSVIPGPDGTWLLHSAPFGVARLPAYPPASDQMTAQNISRATPGARAALGGLVLGLDEHHARLVVRGTPDQAGRTLSAVTGNGDRLPLTLQAGRHAASAVLDLRQLDTKGTTHLTLHDGDAAGAVLRRLRLCPGAFDTLYVVAEDGGKIATLGRAGQFPADAGPRDLHNLSANSTAAGAPKLALRLAGNTLHMTAGRALHPVAVEVRGAGGGLTHVDLNWAGTPPRHGLWQKIRTRLPGPLHAPLPRGVLTGTLDLAPLVAGTPPVSRSLSLQIRTPGLNARRVVQLTYDSDGLFYVVSPENSIDPA